MSGRARMTGTAMSPQLSPAMTVLKSSKLACMTEATAVLHEAQSSKFISWTIGCTISTISMAQTVIIPKQKTKDQSKALRHVAIIVTCIGTEGWIVGGGGGWGGGWGGGHSLMLTFCLTYLTLQPQKVELSSKS